MSSILRAIDPLIAIGPLIAIAALPATARAHPPHAWPVVQSSGPRPVPPPPASSSGASSPVESSSAGTLPGREDDAHVAAIALRIAVAGRARCPEPARAFGLVLQHLSQFRPADRAGVIAVLPLDRGPGVIVVAPGGPATGLIRPGDILLAINGHPLPPETHAAETDVVEAHPAGIDPAPFDAARARARADAILDLLEQAGSPNVTLLRGGEVLTVRVVPVAACPSRVHLARSNQRNAYADGRHVFLTTGVVSRLHGDDELAFLIAHEMAHNILHHAATMRSGSVKRGIGRTFGRSGRIVRETERAADALGAELMLDAGYDPVAGAAILTRLGGGNLGIDLFADHDAADARIAALRALVQARMAPGSTESATGVAAGATTGRAIRHD